MNEKQIEFGEDQYIFERFKYACEKEGKTLSEVVEFFLRNKVVPTSTSDEEVAAG